MDEEFNLWQKLVLEATKPFRVGANVLGQYYGSALTGEDMTQKSNQGKFLQWLSSALTPEEQTQIEEKPYLNALKSSAGMASTLMPFAKAGVVGNVGSKMVNPTLSKFTNLLSRGGLEGGVGGFGYSREGKELQDTLLGMGLGAGGEVLGGLISDPTFRRGMGQEIMKGGVTPEGRYTAFAKLGDDMADDADNVIDLTKDKLYQEAKKYKTPEEFVEKQFSKRPEYAMSHRPTWEGSPPASDLLQGDMLPRDVYDKPEWSIASGRNVRTDPSARESWEALLRIRNKPDAEVTVYRASPKGDLNIGDWVTFSKNYAKGEGVYEGSKVFAHKVRASDILFAGDDINEFGYFPRSKLTDIWKQAHTQYIGDKLPKNKDRYIKILTGEEGDENQLYNLDYKGLKKEPGRISKTHEEDLLEEMRKTAERWGLYR